ncbi:hypothetical protein COCCU_10110 [Corynebacterium occultum]|uniref:DUF3558 domain-containing protein n=1 Tax=Corynebacterium occultum TaxID=2675219 RepID=A0A6B8W5T5_9CORY|nr:DUF3558 family protein [Corynebacterium occultum]QGU07941.1 hypothetical protein COCCU_10110 [Corynebacterium occultum]
MHLADLSRTRQSYSISSISLITALLLSALLCVSCGTIPVADGETDTHPAAGSETEMAAETEPETTAPLIVLGEFEGESDTFDLFDPCTEIPWEVYQKVGFVERVGEPFYDLGLSSSCSLKSPAEQGRFAMVRITGDKVPYDRIVETGSLIDTTAESRLPGVYHHWLGWEENRHCAAAMHTTRGRITVNYFDRDLEGQLDALCAKANKYLEDIHEQAGGV